MSELSKAGTQKYREFKEDPNVIPSQGSGMLKCAIVEMNNLLDRATRSVTEIEDSISNITSMPEEIIEDINELKRDPGEFRTIQDLQSAALSRLQKLTSRLETIQHILNDIVR